MACAQLKTTRNWNRSSTDVGDLVYYGRDELTLSALFNESDVRLFNRVINNPEHVLQQFLTERHIKPTIVSVWKRSSNEAFDLASAQQTHLT